MSYSKKHYIINTKVNLLGDVVKHVFRKSKTRRSKGLKNLSNHKVRNSELSNGGNYKKAFDYKWSMW